MEACRRSAAMLLIPMLVLIGVPTPGHAEESPPLTINGLSLSQVLQRTAVGEPMPLAGLLQAETGQISGVEGYVESAAIGLLAGRMAAAEGLDQRFVAPPATTALGALLRHITSGADSTTFQPMNINCGLFPPLEGRVKRKERKPAMSRRALADLDTWLAPEVVAAE